MAKPLTDYTNRCGSCSHFSFYTKDNRIVRYGRCDCAPTYWFMHNNRRGGKYLAQHSQYRQASAKACRRYENIDEKEEC